MLNLNETTSQCGFPNKKLHFQAMIINIWFRKKKIYITWKKKEYKSSKGIISLCEDLLLDVPNLGRLQVQNR